MTKKLHLIGYAFGLAGRDRGTAKGPLRLQKSPFFKSFLESNNTVSWVTTFQEPKEGSAVRVDESVNIINNQLAKEVATLTLQNQYFSVIGGDHTSAIGTWSGVYDALCDRGDLGLIWIDAHMDSHTPETTESGLIHGMPLACLMGYGYPSLTGIVDYTPKLKPENVVLIGVRSYEQGEADLLKRLNVKVYFMDEVKQRGFVAVLQEAVKYVKQHTVAYGMSMDLDALDPEEVPGVDVPEANGINVEDFCLGLSQVATDPQLIGTEISEFDPAHDRKHLTEKFVVRLLEILSKG